MIINEDLFQSRNKDAEHDPFFLDEEEEENGIANKIISKSPIIYTQVYDPEELSTTIEKPIEAIINSQPSEVKNEISPEKKTDICSKQSEICDNSLKRLEKPLIENTDINNFEPKVKSIISNEIPNIFILNEKDLENLNPTTSIGSAEAEVLDKISYFLSNKQNSTAKINCETSEPKFKELHFEFLKNAEEAIISDAEFINSFLSVKYDTKDYKVKRFFSKKTFKKEIEFV